MNVTQLYQEIGRLLSDPDNDRWPVATLLTRINLAQTIVLAYTNALKTTETLTPTANTATVNLNATTMDLIRVDIQRTNGDIQPLEGMTREKLDFHYPNWQNWTAGQPLTYWFDASNNQINLVPKPDSANAIANGLRVWEVRKPTDLAVVTDIPFDSSTYLVPYHLSIVHWVVAQCWMDDATPESLAKSRFHKSGILNNPGEFEKQISLILEKFDNPEDIPSQILFKPEGGRVGSWGPSKANPLA